MGKLLVAEFISLDGVVQAPGAPGEDTSDGFRFGGWQVPYSDEAIGQAVHDLHSRPFELLLGRRTYDIWAAYWPGVEPTSPSHAIAEKFNGVRKHVATHRPETLDWNNSHALEGNLADGCASSPNRRFPPPSRTGWIMSRSSSTSPAASSWRTRSPLPQVNRFAPSRRSSARTASARLPSSA